MNFINTHIENRRLTQTTEITDQQSLEYMSNTLEMSKISHLHASKTSIVQNSLKPTRSKALISSYAHNMQRQKTVSQQKQIPKEVENNKPINRNTSKKLSLISNTINKQNMPSRANSKQKLHLTTLHPNIPHSMMINSNSRFDTQNKQSTINQRDMFLNISIANQLLDPLKKEQLQYKQRILNLQSELSITYSNLNLTRMTLQSKQKRIQKSQQQIKQLNQKYAILHLQYEQLQLNSKSIQTQTEQRRVIQKQIKQQYESNIRDKNEKTNEVILNYQSQISQLKQQIDSLKNVDSIHKQQIEQLKLHGNLDNINSNKMIRQLEMEKQTLQNQIQRYIESYQHQINCLRQNISKLEEELFNFKQNKVHTENTMTFYSQTIQTYQKQRITHQENYHKINQLTVYSEELKINSQKLQNKIQILTNTLLHKQQNQKQHCSMIESLNKQKQILSQSLQILTQRLQRSNKQLHIVANDRQTLTKQIEHSYKQSEILRKSFEAIKQENNTLQLKVQTYHRSLEQSVNVDQSFLKRLAINTSVQSQSQVYHQIQKKVNYLQSQNHQLKIQMQGLIQQKMTNVQLIIRIQQSIQEKLKQQQIKYNQQYQQLYQKYIIVQDKLEKISRKRTMQKALISQSNNFHQQIYMKCQQIYNATN